MKKTIRLLLLILITIPSISWTQCPTGDIQFSTQQQIDDFLKKYPDCAEIPGNLTIGKDVGTTDIHDLSPLRNISSVSGYLNILNNLELPSLEGLKNITTIGGYLNIYNNDRLIHLDGLKNLSAINGSLWILHNQHLASLEGLQNLITIDGSLDISCNPNLSSLKGSLNINPNSITATLDYLLAQIIDVRISENNSLLSQNPLKKKLYQTDLPPVYHFKKISGIPYHKRVSSTDILYREMELIDDTTNAKTILEEIATIAKSAGAPELIWEARLLKEYYHLKQGSEPTENKIERMWEFSNFAGREGETIIQARAIKFISFVYWFDFPEYQKLFKTYHKLEQIISLLSPFVFPDMAQCYMVIGRAHYYFKDYRKAIHYFRKAATIPKTPFNTTYVMHSRNNLGLSFQKLNFLDSSDLFFQKILQDTTHYPVDVWKGIASGNLGYNQYLRKKYDKAIPLLQRDILTAEAMEDWGLAAGSLIPLADIRVKQNLLQKAEELILKAREYIIKSGQEDRLQLLYPVISKWHSAMGHKNLAADYLDSTQHATRAYNDKFNALKLLRAKQELNANELRLQEIQKQKLIQQRNAVITIVILVFIIGLIFLWYRNKELHRKRELQEIKLKNTQASLENAQSKLKTLTLAIKDNNLLIERLREKYIHSENDEVLMELKSSTIFTKKDWKQFKNLFQQAYPGFLETLENRYNELTPTEIRCLCLQKLQLSNREMAMTQGVSPKSINVTKHRIRKKLNLENQKMLEEMISKIQEQSD